MTGMERVKAAFKGERPDRVPSYPILSGLAARMIGLTPRDYYTNFDNLAGAHIAIYEQLKPDVIALMPDLFLEVEAMGAEIEFPEDDVPRLRCYLLADPTRLSSLSIPDPYSAGRIPAYLEACKKVKTCVAESAVGGVICGPWTLASNLRGAESLIVDTVTDPGFVHELMKFATEIPVRFGEALKQVGVGVSLSEAPASMSLISPKIYREFVMPYQQQVISRLREKRIGVTLHICGFIDPIMEDIASAGAIAISMDQPSSLEKMLEVCDGRAVVIGNVSTSVFVRGTRDDIESEVQRCLAAARTYYRYILATGCEISPRGDLDKVRMFCEIASEVGRYN